MNEDPLEEFMDMVEREYQEYIKYCQHPEDVYLVDDVDSVIMIHCGKVVKRWENPYNDNMLFI